MQILQISPTYKPAYIYGGVTVSISLLCETLATQGHDVTVLSTTANGKEDLQAHTHEPAWVDGVKTFYFPCLTKGTKQFSPPMLWWLWHNVQRFQVVHLHSWWNFDALFSAMICRIRGVKPIFSPRGMLSQYSTKGVLRRFFNRTFGRFALKYSYLHATAPKELIECLPIIPDWKHIVLPNLMVVPNIENINTRASASNGDMGKASQNYLFFSRIHPKKGLENLFEALAKLPFEWTLTIAGDGDEQYIQSLKNKAEKLDIYLKINWIGWVNSTDKYTFLQKADIMLLPSFNENFANVVIESLAVGTPVMISRQTGLSDYIEKEDLGWICDTSVLSIYETLIKTYVEKEKYDAIAARGAACIQRDFAPSVLAQQYVRFYEKCIGFKAKKSKNL